MSNLVRLRYWHQDTLESGHWEVTGLLPDTGAIQLHDSGHYAQSRIVQDEPDWPEIHAAEYDRLRMKP